jgi:hypothetical protein
MGTKSCFWRVSELWIFSIWARAAGRVRVGTKWRPAGGRMEPRGAIVERLALLVKLPGLQEPSFEF